MAFIRNTDKLVEGSSKLFFTEARAQLALQPTVSDLESEDSGIKLRLDVIEGGSGVAGSIAKAQADAQAYADQQVAALVNSAPAILDTLKELSDAIGGDASFASTVAGQIGDVDDKVDQEILDRQAAVSGLESALNLDISALESADAALDLRLDQLELDPVTKTYVDGEISSEQSARQSDVNSLDSRLDVIEGIGEGSVSKAEQDAKDYADNLDSAMDARMLVLEADPTTKAYVDGIESALDGRLDSLEADPTTKAYVDGEVSDLQGQITQEISDRQSADNSLDARLDIIEGLDSVEGSVAKAEKDSKDYADSLDSAMDSRVSVLETDPTTKAYVDGIEAALDGRLDVLESDPVTKTYVDGEVSDLQGQVTTEKGRIDAILSAADADKDTFAEIVTLINSVDTANDSAFAGYVLSNDAAVAALDGRVDVVESDITDLQAEDLLMFKKDGSRNLTGSLILEGASGKNITWDTDGAGNIGASSGNRPNNVYVKLNVEAAGVVKASDGSVSAPSFGFSSAGGANFGMYYASSGHLAFSAGNNLAMRLGTSGNLNTSYRNMQVPDGASNAPGLCFNTDYSSGFFYSGTKIQATIQGTSGLMEISSTAVAFPKNVEFSGGMKVKLSEKSADYTITTSDYFIGLTSVSGGKIMTLPTAVGNTGRVFVIKDQSGSASVSNYIRIAPQAGQNIDGQSNYEIVVPYESVSVVSNGSHWFIM